MQKILIMGLPGSGKTTLASALKNYLEENGRPDQKRIEMEMSLEPIFPTEQIEKCKVKWFNADEVRKKYNDWDFSREGRIRQSLRMAEFAVNSNADYVICDFIAPLVEMRDNFSANWTIWMDTIDQGRFDDTNKAFIPPEIYDFRITEMDAEKWAQYIGYQIINNLRRPVFDWQKETVQMLGRWQPWHSGHRALFERAVKKTGQVCIMIRDCQGWNNSNPFKISEVINYIRKDLDPYYQGMYEILVVPNITNITYGRDVGYTITQEKFSAEIESVSATEIRKTMGV